jgi:hypothetical protein
MITLTENKINTFSQKSYDEMIESLNFNKLTCSCNVRGQLIKHAYYKRKFKNPDEIAVIKILRIICKSCGKTHALLPDIIVPYSQISFPDHVSIIRLYHSKGSFEPLMIENEYIDESNIQYIIRQYLRHWKERIAALRIQIDDSKAFVFECLKNYKRQFMQIKCTPNILFS